MNDREALDALASAVEHLDGEYCIQSHHAEEVASARAALAHVRGRLTEDAGELGDDFLILCAAEADARGLVRIDVPSPLIAEAHKLHGQPNAGARCSFALGLTRCVLLEGHDGEHDAVKP